MANDESPRAAIESIYADALKIYDRARQMAAYEVRHRGEVS